MTKLATALSHLGNNLPGDLIDPCICEFGVCGCPQHLLEGVRMQCPSWWHFPFGVQHHLAHKVYHERIYLFGGEQRCDVFVHVTMKPFVHQGVVVPKFIYHESMLWQQWGDGGIPERRVATLLPVSAFLTSGTQTPAESREYPRTHWQYSTDLPPSTIGTHCAFSPHSAVHSVRKQLCWHDGLHVRMTYSCRRIRTL